MKYPSLLAVMKLPVTIVAGVAYAIALSALIACGDEAPDIEATVEARIAEERADEAAKAAEIEAGVAATMVALAVPTLMSTPIPTHTPTLTPDSLPTERPTETPTSTPTVTPTHTSTLTPADTPTNTPVPTAAPTSTYTPTNTPTPTTTPTPTATHTPLPTNTPPPTPTPTATPTPTSTYTPVPTNTPLPTPTPEPSIADVVDQARKSVVHIVGSTGSGSGFVVESTGYILTNAHVVEDETDLTVVLDGGIRTLGKVVIQDPERDIALIKIDKGQQPVLRFATANPRIGEEVVALGYPFGVSYGLENMTISTGVVSAIQSFDDINYVQTDAAINPGNSGGPLLDMNGQVVGMNTSGISKNISEGLNFAIHYNVLYQRLAIMIVEATAPPTPTPTRTPTPAPTPTPDAIDELIRKIVGEFGPIDGSIKHDPDDGFIDEYEADVSITDGIIEARFFNPYSSQTGSWGSGFLFRLGTDRFHTVFVTQSGQWYHYLRTGDASNDQQVRSGFSTLINTDAYGSNFVRIIAIGREGTLFVNGEFVATLDLSGLLDAGRVSAIAGYFSDNGVAGESTQFEDFKITPIQSIPSFGPADGSIEHKDDGLIDVYGTNVSLADGIIEARFFNPYSSQTGSWSNGFIFRWAPSSPDNIFHTVVITQAERWHHILRIGDGEHQRLKNGSSTAIATGEYDSNHIRVIAIGGDGALYVNGKFIATLDLSGITDAGRVSAITGYFNDSVVAGRSTQFEDFQITSIQ